ncbi:MAG: response regulator transcription factor [Lysinibacillus sp.]
MTVNKILIVEDEKNIARFMKLELQHEGFNVEVCENGRLGLEMALTNQFDCVLLDVMLPELNGIEVCRRLRKQSDVPVVLITARDAVMDRVAGLDAGADDYVVKPFAIEELLARIRSVLRRVRKKDVASTKLTYKKIMLDDESYEVFLDKEKVDLTKTEYELLKYLMVHKNKVCPREQIIEHVWGFDSEIETNVVDVYIRHLRTKLKQDEPIIETVRGVGYVMRE